MRMPEKQAAANPAFGSRFTKFEQLKEFGWDTTFGGKVPSSTDVKTLRSAYEYLGQTWPVNRLRIRL